MMSKTNSVVAVFESHEQAEEAIRELQKDGFDMKKQSTTTTVHVEPTAAAV